MKTIITILISVIISIGVYTVLDGTTVAVIDSTSEIKECVQNADELIILTDDGRIGVGTTTYDFTVFGTNFTVVR